MSTGPPMRGCLVFNPQAGSADRIKDFLSRLDAEVRWEIRLVPNDEAVQRLGEDLRSDVFDRLVVGGGDGTLGRVVGALAPDFPPVDVAVLPMGTGNDTARSLGVHPDDMEEAMRRAASERGVPVDAVRMAWDHGETWFANVANGGMGGKIAQDVSEQDKKRWGTMAYWVASVMTAVARESYEVRLSMDGETVEADLFGVAIANGRYLGGGFPIARHALMDDGWLDVTTVPAMHGLELVAAGIDFALERERMHERGLGTYRARRIEVSSVPELPFSIDGEPVRRSNATFEVVPGALRMVPGSGDSALTDG